MNGWRARVTIGVLTLLAALAAHPICDLLFSCGCVFFSTDHCNMHRPGPQCPWCTTRWGFPLAGGLWLVGIVVGVGFAARRGWRAPALAAAGVAGLVVGVALSGVVSIAISGYPTLLGVRWR